jgi:hypothetical protein
MARLGDIGNGEEHKQSRAGINIVGLKGKCKYATYCKYYKPSKMCLTDDVASSECGTYDLFDNYIICSNEESKK